MNDTAPMCRILVADDNEDAAESLAMLLQLHGHDVRVARDGKAALDLAESFRPQLALLDLGMPRLDGYATAQAIRAQPWGTSIHLIAVTGYSQPADRARAMGAGIDRFMVKPVDATTLEQICREIAAGA